MLDEKLKKIDEVFKMVSEIYRNGPTKGLSQISLREQTPPLKRRSVSRSLIWGKSTKLAPSIPIRFLPLGDIDRTTKESTTDEGIDICVDLWVRGGLQMLCILCEFPDMPWLYDTLLYCLKYCLCCCLLVCIDEFPPDQMQAVISC